MIQRSYVEGVCILSGTICNPSNISLELNILSQEAGSGLGLYAPPDFSRNTLLHVISNYYENCFWK